MRRLLPVWAAIIGLLVIVGTGFAVAAWIQLQHERKHNTLTACISRENEHAALRSVLHSFKVPDLFLPEDPVTRRRVFAPLPGNGSVRQRCEEYTRDRT